MIFCEGEIVMKDGKSGENRSRIIGLRVTQKEFVKLEKRWQESTCSKLSAYVRNCIFDKPITTIVRDGSMDEMMAQLTLLRRELNAIGNNFNQSVKKLHTLNQLPEFRAWLVSYEIERKTLFNKVDEVKDNVRKLAEKWLR